MRGLVVLALVALVGCRDSTAPGTMVGTWHLYAVNAVRVPTKADSCAADGVYGGTLDLRTGGSYAMVVRYQHETCGTTSAFYSAGTYTSADGRTVSLSNSGIPFSVTYTGREIEQANAGAAYRWRK